MYKLKIFGWGILIGIFLFSCKEKNDFDFVSPYKNKKESPIQFKDELPDPESGTVGDQVTVMVKGLNQVDDFTIYIHQVKAEVLSVSDSSVRIEVPKNASSGAISVKVKGRNFFGPLFKVDGKVSIAASFKTFNGANGPINQMIEKSDGNFLIVGGFTDYDNQAASEPINHIALIDNKGKFLGRLNAGKGANGSINTVVRNPINARLIIGGGFGTYDGVSSGINNLAKLNSDASLQTKVVDLKNPYPEEIPNGDKDTVSAFNGGVVGGRFSNVVKLFYNQSSNQVLVVGNFQSYKSIYYPLSIKNGYYFDQTEIAQLVRLNFDGSPDSSFNYNKQKEEGGKGGNGPIYDAVRIPGGKIVLVGDFTTFEGVKVNRICVINESNGELIENNLTGRGADGPINKITYNAHTHRLLVVGDFNHFGGEPANGVVMLKENMLVDPTFSFGETTEGRANFAGQLDNGKILVSGRFLTYNGVIRSGFMILNPDGSLAEGYNNTGSFVGQINQIVESKTALNKPGVILVGRFSQFDNQNVGNIVKIALDNG